MRPSLFGLLLCLFSFLKWWLALSYARVMHSPLTPPLAHFFPAGFCVLHTFFPYGVLVCVHWCTFFPYGVFVHLSFSIAEGSPPRGPLLKVPYAGLPVRASGCV